MHANSRKLGADERLTLGHLQMSSISAVEMIKSNRIGNAIGLCFQFVDIIGYLLSMVVVLLMFSAHVRSINQYPYFSPISNVEELAYTYISSGNFNRFGFSATDFLQDFAASPDRADHPYVYDHMPPGPDIARALVMRATGGSFVQTGIVFASLVPVGFVFYFLFLRRIMSDNHLLLGGAFLLILTPWLSYLPHFSNPIWNGFLVLTFVPLVTLQWAYDRKANWLIYAVTLPVTLLAALYLDYIVFSSVLVCWAGLYVTQIVRVGKRELIMILGTAATGILLNLLKNVIYFGPSLFIQELVYVLGNRNLGLAHSTGFGRVLRCARHFTSWGARSECLGLVGCHKIKFPIRWVRIFDRRSCR